MHLLRHTASEFTSKGTQLPSLDLQLVSCNRGHGCPYQLLRGLEGNLEGRSEQLLLPCDENEPVDVTGTPKSQGFPSVHSSPASLLWSAGALPPVSPLRSPPQQRNGDKDIGCSRGVRASANISPGSSVVLTYLHVSHNSIWAAESLFWQDDKQILNRVTWVADKPAFDSSGLTTYAASWHRSGAAAGPSSTTS